MKSLALESKLVVCADAAAAGTSTVTGSVVDRQGAEKVRFTALLGDVTATSVLTLKAQAGDAANGSDMADITGATATFTAGATDADLKALVVEVVKPTKKYVRCVLTRATANAVVNGIIADVYDWRNTPAPAGDVIASTVKQG